MDVKQELKAMAKVHRWAFEELTFDLCMKESNRMEGKYKEQFRYLKERFGSGHEVLRRALDELKILRIPPPEGSKKEQLKQVIRLYTWVFDTMVVEEKERQAVELFSSVQVMYRFMLSELLNAYTVWENLKWLVLVQRSGRRKTICLAGN